MGFGQLRVAIWWKSAILRAQEQIDATFVNDVVF